MIKASELLFDAVFDRELGVIWIFNEMPPPCYVLLKVLLL